MSNVKLEEISELELRAREPFNFKYSVYKPSHFPTGLEYYDNSSDEFYRALKLSRSKVVGLRMKNLRTVTGEDGIFVKLYSNENLNEEDITLVKEHITRSYGLDEDMLGFYDHFKNNEKIMEAITALYGMRNSCFENLFEILNISLLLQNATVKRSEGMMKAMLSNFGDIVEYNGVKLYVFYTPYSVAGSSETKLRSLGVGYRAKFLMSIAKYFVEHPDFEESLKRLPFKDVKADLIRLKGVGPYSAGVVLFAYFRDADSLSLDTWNWKLLSKFVFEHECVSYEKLKEVCKAKWSPYKGYVGLYITEYQFVKDPALQYWREKHGSKF